MNRMNPVGISNRLAFHIIPFTGNAVSHSSPGVFHITGIAGNNMAMEMKDGLSGSGAAIHTDIIAIGLMGGLNDSFGRIDEQGQFNFFCFGEGEIIRTNSIGND